MNDEIWVFSGHGSQWPGMGRDLLAEPVFAEVVDGLEPVFREEIGFSPRRVLAEADYRTTDRVQAMIFVIQVGLAGVLRSFGAAPAAVFGHSVGEVAAAVVGGALTLQDAGRLICRRSVLLRRVVGQGAMAMVLLPFAETERRLGGRPDPVAAVAAAPSGTVVSGTPAAVRDFGAELRAGGIGAFRIASDVGFHSGLMDPLLDELTAAAADLRPRPYRLPVYSTVLRDPRSAPPADGPYWAANLREPVRLVGAVSAAVEDGHRAFLEVSPHPVVTHSIGRTLTALAVPGGTARPTLRRNTPWNEALAQCDARSPLPERSP